MTMKSSTNRQRGSLEAWASFIVLALIVVIWLGSSIAWNSARETRVCTVVEKLATGKKDGGNNYILITDRCGQLQVEDSWTNGQFNSTDLYARIKAGTSYTFETVGWRNGLFSQYPNVVKVSQ
jgi:hypothetical protein